MGHCHWFTLRIVFACTLLVLGIPPAAAQPEALLSDRIYGSADVIQWSEGVWSLGGEELPTCGTFAGGIQTDENLTQAADSVLCDRSANGWNWRVTLPSGSVITWNVTGLPLDTEVCGEIFYSPTATGLHMAGNVLHDILTIRSPDYQVLYVGPWSSFDPGELGLLPTAIRRCGTVYRVQPTRVESVTWGRIKALHL